MENIKPRKVIYGNSLVTALKCRNEELLIGREDGKIELIAISKDSSVNFS